MTREHQEQLRALADRAVRGDMSRRDFMRTAARLGVSAAAAASVLGVLAGGEEADARCGGGTHDGKTVDLQLTYPVGNSPKVFTSGWLFGAKCIVKPGNTDLSKQVRWFGTGKFHPDIGSRSRPVFAWAGTNTIRLEVTVDGKKHSREYTVVAVRPIGYARQTDKARCPSDAHGCPACAHTTIGPIIAGSPTVLINGLPAARVGDPGIHAACCGPNTYKIAAGDPTVLIDGKPAARKGDRTTHCGGTGKIVEGSPGDDAFSQRPADPEAWQDRVSLPPSATGSEKLEAIRKIFGER